ncbi:MAG TPA: hypothetical protein VNR17_09485 [Luteimicrobium sp.]|nr:hypothetical protein [Luteimicrobium sp.]
MDARKADDLEAVCRAVALLLPDDAAFSGTTAAALWGLPLERPVQAAAAERLRVIGRAGRRPVDTPRVVSHAGLRPGERVTRRGVPVTTPARTWRDLGTEDLLGASLGPHSSGVDQRHEALVVVTDAVLAPDALRDVPRYGVVPQDLRSVLTAARGARGTRALRAALVDARRFVDSAMETRLRLRLLASGFPCPVVGADLVTADGEWVARPDVCWPEVRVGIEYDGESHVNRRRLASDAARREAMERVGWRSMVVYAQDVGLRWPATVGRLRDMLALQGCTDPSRLRSYPDVAIRPRIRCQRL